MQQSHFSLQRLWNLILIEIRFSILPIVLSLLVPLIIFYFMSLIPEEFTVHDMVDKGMYMLKLYLMVGVAFYASYAFTSMYTKPENHFWYMLPANSLEKFISKLLVYLVFYVVFIVLGFMLVMYVGDMFFMDEKYNFKFVEDVFLPQVALYYKTYLLYTSILLVGASFFKKDVFIRTTASILLIILLVMVSLYVLNDNAAEVAEIVKNNTSVKGHIAEIDIYTYIIFIIILWALSYGIMKRTQVSDGI